MVSTILARSYYLNGAIIGSVHLRGTYLQLKLRNRVISILLIKTHSFFLSSMEYGNTYGEDFWRWILRHRAIQSQESTVKGKKRSRPWAMSSIITKIGCRRFEWPSLSNPLSVSSISYGFRFVLSKVHDSNMKENDDFRIERRRYLGLGCVRSVCFMKQTSSLRWLSESIDRELSEQPHPFAGCKDGLATENYTDHIHQRKSEWHMKWACCYCSQDSLPRTEIEWTNLQRKVFFSRRQSSLWWTSCKLVNDLTFQLEDLDPFERVTTSKWTKIWKCPDSTNMITPRSDSWRNILRQSPWRYCNRNSSERLLKQGREKDKFKWMSDWLTVDRDGLECFWVKSSSTGIKRSDTWPWG